MKRSLLRHIKNQRGFTFVFTLLILIMSMIFVSTVFTVYSGNLRQTKHQEHYMEAYYLAYSGVEMAFTALIADENELFNEIKNGTTTSLTEEDIAFEDGSVDIEVTKSNDANYVGWIKISSTGTLGSYDISRTRTLYIDPSNQKNTVWK